MAASFLACDGTVSGSPDAGVDAAPVADARPAPAVTGILVDGAAALEVRQGGTAALTLQGEALGTVRYVQVGAVVAAIKERSDTEISATLKVPHGLALGARPVVLTGDSVITLPISITVTPVVVAADGRDDGRGTFAAPLRLCAPTLPAALAAGDTLQLRAGTHRCAGSLAIPRGVVVRGEGADQTIVRDDGDPFAGLVFDGTAGTTEVRDVTLTASAPAIRVAAGDVVIDGVVVADSSDGLVLASGGAAMVTGYTYRGGSRLGVLVDGGTMVTARGVRIDGCLGGIAVNHGTLDATDVDIRACTQGLVGTGEVGPTARKVEIRATGLDVAGTGVAVRLDGGSLTLTDPVLDATGASGTTTGILHRGGDLTVTGGRITGWSTAVELGLDVGIAGVVVNADLTGVELSGATAIRHVGTALPSRVRIRQTRANSTAVALLITGAAVGSTIDLGTTAEPGGNALTCPAQGGVGIDDTRATVTADIDMHGSTINGRTFMRSFPGPAVSLPDFRIRAANVLRF